MELSVILKGAVLLEEGDGARELEDTGENVLIYSLSGESFILCNGEARTLPEGEMYLSACSESFRLVGWQSVIILYFEVSSGCPSELFGKVIRPTDRQSRQLGEILRELKGCRDGFCRYGSDGIIENSLSNILLLLKRGEELEINEELVMLSEEVRNHPQAVRHYLLENYTSRITLNNLCYLFRTNKTALCREFRREYGKTVLEYLHELRIAEAKRLLRSGMLSVTDISDRLGFESIHYFSRLFKKMLGVSPTEYASIEKKKQKLMEEI